MPVPVNKMTPNPSLHLTFDSWLRRLSPAGALKRWAEAFSAEKEMNQTEYTKINSTIIDGWVRTGWEWGVPIGHESFERAKCGEWEVLLTPTKPVPKDWFPDLLNRRILGLAAGGGQQMPVFSAAGAFCTVFDISEEQLWCERDVSEREEYAIEIIQGDMAERFPFADNTFDLIFHPVSNVYVEEVESIWKECHRVLKNEGILMSGLDNGICFAFDEELKQVVRKLPFNPLQDKDLLEESIKKGRGIQFSHTIEEQIGGQLRAGFCLTDIYSDTDNFGNFMEHNIPAYWATRSTKKKIAQ